VPPDVSAVTAALQQRPVAEACTQFGQACLYGLLHTAWSAPGTHKAPRARRTWGTGEAEPGGPAQWPLLALAPALSGLMGPPGAAVFVVLRHLHAMLAAPALRLLGVRRGWQCRSLHLEPF